MMPAICRYSGACEITTPSSDPFVTGVYPNAIPGAYISALGNTNGQAAPTRLTTLTG